MDPALAERHEKNRKIAIIVTSTIFLVAMVAAVAVGISQALKDNDDDDLTTSNKAIRDVCQPTDYRHACEETLADSSVADSSDPIQIIQAEFRVAVNEIQKAIAKSTTIRHAYADPRTVAALETCREVMNYAMRNLEKSVDHLNQLKENKVATYVEDLRVWLSGAVTYQEVCLDAFANSTADVATSMRNLLNVSRELTTNGLVMADEIAAVVKPALVKPARRLLAVDENGLLPDWVDAERRRILEDPDTKKADLVVAKDGSSEFRSVNQALRKVPLKSTKMFVIKIKEGDYHERVQVTYGMWNVVFIGDGPTKTKITGRLNLAEGTSGYKTPPMIVIGENFMAKDIGFENYAGAAKGTAVALYVHSDRSIFHNCQVDGHTNTLTALNHRQFYRDCTISGCLDFITGDASAVFQNCRLVVRRPSTTANPSITTVTAQARSNKRESSGFVLHNCTITPDPDYALAKEDTKSYLGRPAKEFSRTIIMQSQIDDVIDPEGWVPSMGKPDGTTTCFYAEYMNRGPGAAQGKRVKWAGIQHLGPAQAEEFTAGKFLGGDEWIKPSGIPYTGGMMNV